MNSSINCKLHGAYKVDLYSGGGPNRKFVSSTEWFDNDITNYGLNYPYVFSFADCFKFLSLGSVAWGSSSGRQNATVTKTPITGFWVYNNNSGIYPQSGQYIGWQGYEIGGNHNSTFAGSFSSACGTKFTNNGIDLHRGWTLPTGAIDEGTVMAQDLTINGFMVSPGSGLSLTGSGAFSLVDRTVVIPSGFTATITYQLSLDFLSYQARTYFSGVSGDSNGYFDTSTAATGTSGSETGLLSGWAKLSGIYRQILPGVQIVDGIGASIIPSWGDQLEPKYTDCQKLYFYLSADNSQFAVSQYGALVAGLSESGAYNSDGLMANYTSYANLVSGDLNIHGQDEDVWPTEPDRWYYSGDSQTNSSTQVTVPIASNIRLQALLPINNYSGGPLDPNNYNYQVKGYVSPYRAGWPVSFATPGKLGFDIVDYPDYGQRAVYSTYLKRVPTSGFNSPTGNFGLPVRSKKATKRGIFSPVQSMGYNSRYATMTLGYLSAAGSIGDLTFQPYVDFMFFDTSGRAADMAHYRLLPDVYMADRGSGVGQVRFDITGNDGNRLASVNRLFNIYGFMGPGVNPNNPSTPSGLDITHPLFNSPTVPTGFVFPGQILNTNVTGSTTQNNGTGWGAVYGVSVTPTFYTYPIDTCLIDDRPWSGTTFLGWTGDLSGLFPNPTGDYSKLFWPSTGSGVGLRISGVEYYSPVLGYLLNDTGDYFKSGNNQVLFDILYTGNEMLGAPTRSLGSFTGVSPVDGFSTIAFSDGITTPLTTAFTPTQFIFNSGANSIHLSYNTGYGNVPFYGGGVFIFSGFNVPNDTGHLTTGIGLNRNWTADTFNKMVMSGMGTNAKVGTNGGNDVYLVYWNSSTWTPLNISGNYVTQPSQYKKPSGLIHHLENYNGTGNRLLPNYGIPNNQTIDYYQPVKGGTYPGMSMQNGMQVFCDFVWSGG